MPASSCKSLHKLDMSHKTKPTNKNKLNIGIITGKTNREGFEKNVTFIVLLSLNILIKILHLPMQIHEITFSCYGYLYSFCLFVVACKTQRFKWLVCRASINYEVKCLSVCNLSILSHPILD